MTTKRKLKSIEIIYEPIPVTQEKLDEIFFYLFDELAKIGVLDRSVELSDTYNSLENNGDDHE